MNADLVLQLLITTLANADKIAKLLATANVEGRDVTVEELNMLQQSDDTARTLLQAAIDKAE